MFIYLRALFSNVLSGSVNGVTPFHWQTVAEENEKRVLKTKSMDLTSLLKFGMTETAEGKVRGEATIWHACVWLAHS